MARQFNSKIQNWRVDPDGMLRITAHVLKEGVYPYGPEEAPDLPELRGLTEIQEFIPAAEFTDLALASLEGKPAIVESHEWREPGNTLKDGLTVGAVAGAPKVTDDGLAIECDMIIYDPAAIKAVQEGKLVEVSAAYDGGFVVENGDYAGKPFQARQTDLRFNHILLLPAGQGRCGADVRIINQKEGERRMGEQAYTLKIQIGNKVRTCRFSNEEDAKVAEEMVEEQKAFNAEEVAKSLAAVDQLRADKAELEKHLTEHEGLLAAAKAELEKVTNPEALESLAEEMVEQNADEEAVVEVEADDREEEGETVNEAEKEQMLNSIRAGKTLAARRKNAVDLIMTRRKNSVQGWDQATYDGAFKVLAMNAKTRVKNKARKAPAGQRQQNSGGHPADLRSRAIGRQYELRNQKGGK